MSDNERKKTILSFNKEQWPQVVLMLVVTVGGIFLIMFANTFGSRSGNAVAVSGNSATGPPREALPASVLEQEEGGLAGQLEGILSQIQGAGKVAVTVKMASGSRYEYATNLNVNTRQSGSGGGGEGQPVKEDSQEHQVVLAQANGGGQQPVVVQEKPPEVRGVLVVAQGGGDPWVRWQISRAVQTLLGVSPDQVEVLPREKGGVSFDGGDQ
ncbi:MAG: hypothetical protein D9V47_09755 [Clostridia bacterium]|nr:MAG: hypothetical protein D9V47_09755 [Clostridia bacterium]